MSQTAQRRRFCVTVNPGHINPEWAKDEETDEYPEIPLEDLKAAYRDWWATLAEFPDLLWRKGQIEVSDKGLVHIQAAVRLRTSKRGQTLRRKLGGHFEPARNWAALSRYVQKTSDRLEFLGEDGQPEEGGDVTSGYGSAKLRAIEALKFGMTPTEIAQTDPEAYFTHHRSIEALWEKLKEAERLE